MNNLWLEVKIFQRLKIPRTLEIEARGVRGTDTHVLLQPISSGCPRCGQPRSQQCTLPTSGSVPPFPDPEAGKVFSMPFQNGVIDTKKSVGTKNVVVYKNKSPTSRSKKMTLQKMYWTIYICGKQSFSRFLADKGWRDVGGGRCQVFTTWAVGGCFKEHCFKQKLTIMQDNFNHTR